MAFPTVIELVEQQVVWNASNYLEVDMPSTVNSGELLLFVVAKKAEHDFTTPTGWTGVDDFNGGSNHNVGIYYKTADGTEGGTTVQVGTPGSGSAVAHVYRISGFNSVEISAFTRGSSASPDSASFTPTYSTADTLWIAYASIAGNPVPSLTGGPTGYSNFNDITSTDTNGVSIATARLENNAASEDPGSFTASASQSWKAGVIAIEPEAGHAPLVAETGSYSLTGQDAGLIRSYPLVLNNGAYDLVGQNTGLIRSYPLSMQQGAYNLTGQDTGLIRSYPLALEKGTYDLAGQDLGLLRSYLLGLNLGSYALTGNDVIIVKDNNYSLSLDSGSYGLTGNDTELIRSYSLALDQGSYVLTGNDLLVIKDIQYSLSLESGSYDLEGNGIAIKYGDKYYLAPDSGSYDLQGNILWVHLPATYFLTANAGSYSLSGQDVSIGNRVYYLLSERGSYKYSGFDLDFANIVFQLSLDSGSYQLSGVDQNIRRNFALELQGGSYALSGFPLSESRSLIMPLEAGVYSVGSGGLLVFRDIENTNIIKGNSLISDKGLNSSVLTINGLSTINEI